MIVRNDRMSSKALQHKRSLCHSTTTTINYNYLLLLLQHCRRRRRHCGRVAPAPFLRGSGGNIPNDVRINNTITDGYHLLFE
jgi:hypothetical protein